MDYNLSSDKIINTMETMLSALRKFFDIEFERCWQILKKDKNKCPKVKRNFVREIVWNIYSDCNDTLNEYKLDTPSIEDIVNYVFHYHYFYTSKSSDSERANLQKNSDYKDKLKREITETFINKGYTTQYKSVTTPYNPEINTCIFLCDHVFRILKSLPKKTDMNDPEKQRYYLLIQLFFKAFSFVRSIIVQLTCSLPSEAIINWRALFELEYTIRVLNRYDHVLSQQYQKFGEFSLLDKDSEPKKKQEFEEYAKRYNRNTNDTGFKNYGWLLCLDHDESPLTLRSLLKICKEEPRYKAYQAASNFVHSNSSIFLYPQQEIYIFLMRQIYISISNLLKSIEDYFIYYEIIIEENVKKRLSELWKDYENKCKKDILP